MLSPFVFGIDGLKKPDKKSVELLKKTQPCGVILFAKNIASRDQVKGFIKNLEDVLGRKLLIMIDHEGGLICRFSQGATHFPGNFALGKIGEPRLAYQVGQAMAEELVTLGINVNLAPVLDVLTPKYNPGITIRSFGSDAKKTAFLGTAMIRGMQEHGLSATAKHFPGKGAATQDAHETLPTIKKSQAGFMKSDLVPFKAAIEAGVDLVMSTHVYCPSLEEGTDSAESVPLPTTFSRKIMNDLLRAKLGFGGVTITDDLGMGAITEREGPARAALRAARAGHDILLLCHNIKSQIKAFEGYQNALGRGQLSFKEHQERLARIRNLLEKPRPKPSQKINWVSHQKLAKQIAQKTVRIVRQGFLKLPLSPRQARNVVFLAPDLSSLKSRFTFEPETQNLPSFINRHIQRKGFFPPRHPRPRFHEGRLRGGPVLDSRLRGNDSIFIFFCFDATNFKSQKQTLHYLEQKAQKNLAVVLIRNPWDIKLISPKTTVIDALGFRKIQLEASLNLFF